MCGGGGGSNSTDRIAQEQRDDQKKREARIRQGMDMIKKVFEGGKVYDVNTTPQLPAGQQWVTPTQSGTYFTSGTHPDLAGQLYGGAGGPIGPQLPPGTDPSQVPTMGEVGYKEYKGFGDDFYNSRARAYMEYANPQVSRQYGDAREALTYALSNAGTLNSSVAADKFGDVEQDYQDARRTIADHAQDEANKARAAVADERSRVTQMLHATGDPGAAMAGIGSVLQSLRSQPAFNPIGPVFQNVTAGIGSYMGGHRYRQTQDRVNNIYSRDPSQGSGRSVGGG